jgi:DNA-binding response OmpR family regulator
MAKKLILLVEDDANLGFITKDQLEEAGFKVHWEKGGEDALDAFCAQSFDLCILDVMLPQKDGFTLLSDIRKINHQVPIIMLTAKSLDEDKIKGFKDGADDYVTKPFNFDLLLLRIQSILKRANNIVNDTDNAILQIGILSLDTQNNLLIGPNNYIQKLTKKECDILKVLISYKGQTVKRDQVLKLIWGESDYFKGRSMDVFITKIRKYLQVDTSIQLQNIHGVGFKLDF